MSTIESKYYTITHPPVPYICFSSSIPFSQLPTLAQKIPQLFAILASTTPPTTPTGPPFFHYVAIPAGMGRNQLVDMEVGVPVPEGFELSALDSPDGAISGEVPEVKYLPVGTYLETIHVGAPSTLMEATRKYLQYAEKQGLEFDVWMGAEGSLTERDKGGDGEIKTQLKDRWAARLEWYQSDPAVVEEDRWRTRLSFKLK